ncbi:hypothetical protein B0H21DRAFT_744037 [Amylocystis lapponica]|nr:hypothetical protein B0H21DRAFT_744037 [Amylocystis lapponica]
MLSTLGKNGVVESLTAARRYRVAVDLHRRFHSVPVVRPPWQCQGGIVSASFAIRSLTTAVPPRPAKSSTGTAPQDIPTTASRKNKVELRPGPVKPSKTPPAVAPVSKAPAAAHVAPTPHTSTSPSTPVSSTESLVEATKHDFEDASQHGILAPPPEGASWPRRLFHQAKEFFKFYMRGIKLIETNRRRARAMRDRVKAGGAPLTRWETRFISTNRTDIVKLVPFALIILVIEEIIPLIVLYAPFVLPSTCILPSQKDRIDAKRREKQKLYAANHKQVLEQLRRRALEDPSVPMNTLLDHGAAGPVGGLLCLSTLGPAALQLRRIKRQLAAIVEDDAVLKRESLGQRLTQAEMRDALEERGIITDGLPQKQWQTRLHWWLTHADVEGADPIRQRVLLVASSAVGRF